MSTLDIVRLAEFDDRVVAAGDFTWAGDLALQRLLQGVLQGCKQGPRKSPLLWNAMLNEVMAPVLREWQREWRGYYLPALAAVAGECIPMTWPDAGPRCNHLGYTVGLFLEAIRPGHPAYVK